MKNMFIRKTLVMFFAIILISTTFFTFNDVQAYSTNESTLEANNDYSEEDADTEKIIMCYDAKTGEETEVDMQSLKRSILQKINLNTDSITLDPIEPLFTEDEYNSDNPSLCSTNDSMTRVTDTSKIPYKTTCRIEADDSKGGKMYATAAIVGNHVAVTCAHCIFDADNNDEIYKNWTIKSGYNGGSYYGPATGWDKVYYGKGWKDTHDHEYDWAICILQAEVGNYTGAFRSDFCC